jgi:hypothetical protein
MGDYRCGPTSKCRGWRRSSGLRRAGQELMLGDRRQIERYALTQIDGLFDTPTIRETRTAISEDHGSQRGKQLLDERTVGMTGYTQAGSFPVLRTMQRVLSTMGGPDPLEGKRDDGELVIEPVDYDLVRRYRSISGSTGCRTRPF